MKKMILYYMLLFTSLYTFGQSIDSVKITLGDPTSIVYVKGIKPDMLLSNVTIISLNDINNTQVINLFFKGCPLNQQVFPYDTTINIEATHPFSLKIYSYHDTSFNCPYPTLPLLTDSAYFSFSQIVGNTDFENELAISCYPNPTKNEIMISAGAEINRVLIYSIEGKRLYDNVIKKKQFKILTDFLPNGCYLIVLKTKNKGTYKKKIIKY